MAKGLFVNLAVKDLEKSKAFWENLGFSFEKRFSDKNAACLILGENIYAMLLTEKFFKSFTKKKLADTKDTVEALNAVSFESKKEVDRIMSLAVKSGGKTTRPVKEEQGMYGGAFDDPDGHTWEIFFMDEKAMGGIEAAA